MAYAARQYLSMSRDKSWLSRDGGVQMLRSIAEYFASRAEFNPALLEYEIKGEDYRYSILSLPLIGSGWRVKH